MRVNQLKADKARKWVERFDSDLHADIEKCQTFTSLDGRQPTKTYNATRCVVLPYDVLSAISVVADRKLADRLCVLNFASYHTPGGGFIRGMTAQEEDLCHSSGLYPLLAAHQDDWYTPHRLSFSPVNGSDFIYSTDVPFYVGGEVVHADVLTMAAVNFRHVDEATQGNWARARMDARMEIAYSIPAAFGCDVVMLGAWGCGVFKNDPRLVANKWNELFQKNAGMYKLVLHPVPYGKNFVEFERVFGSVRL